MTETVISHSMPGDVIKEIRALENIPLRSLESTSGYGRGVISGIENQTRGQTKVRTYFDLLDAMGYDVIARRRDE